MNDGETLCQTDEFARQTKVTVRTLHYYDRIGLLKPARRTSKGFRLYGEREFARLQQITTLKFVGFSLNQIKEIIGQQQFDLAETLQLQRKVIEAQRNRLNLALKAITLAEKNFNQTGLTDWESFRQIIEVINMEENWDWTRKYYSEEALKKIEEQKSSWSPELQDRVSSEWKKLFSDIKNAIIEGVSPADEQAQTLAARWNSLIDEFTGGDAEIRKGLDKMYADEKNWQTEWNKPFNDEVRNFISEAMKKSET